jgi:hypothetical protein
VRTEVVSPFVWSFARRWARHRTSFALRGSATTTGQDEDADETEGTDGTRRTDAATRPADGLTSDAGTKESRATVMARYQRRLLEVNETDAGVYLLGSYTRALSGKLKLNGHLLQRRRLRPDLW